MTTGATGVLVPRSPFVASPEACARGGSPAKWFDTALLVRLPAMSELGVGAARPSAPMQEPVVESLRDPSSRPLQFACSRAKAARGGLRQCRLTASPPRSRWRSRCGAVTRNP